MSNELAAAYGRQLLRDCGEDTREITVTQAATDAQRWLECGLADLVGPPGEPLQTPPLPLASHADGALAAFESLAGCPLPFDGRGAELLTLRARTMGLAANGATSPNGSCRLLQTRDGVIALNLSRDSDWTLLPAWLRETVPGEWPAVAERVQQKESRELVDQGRLLGLAVADAVAPDAAQRGWVTTCHRSPAPPPERERSGAPRVLDLSSLWAGPLCSRLLAWAGFEVTKLESTQRPDGARQGSPSFFDFLNEGKQHLSLDFRSGEGVAELRRLIAQSDIVIEGSRPRALRQLGIHAEELLDANPGLTWVSITGHGRDEPRANWIAYGDDAAIAAGLSAAVHRATGQWLICGDAIADPLTGMHAALAALAGWQAGGGSLLSLSLVDTVRHCIGFSAAQAA